jgi:catechol 2,3-dioxygenase-like lactoylglutathione lyase family enzyme
VNLTHVRLLVSDMSASYRFYRDALGLPTTWDENPGYAEFEVGPEHALAIFPRSEMAETVDLRPDGGDGAVLVFSVESVDDEVARLRAEGVEVGDPFDRRDWGLRAAHLRDPDGNLVELYHDIEWEHDP